MENPHADRFALAQALEQAAAWLRRVNQLPNIEDIRFSDAKDQAKLCVELLRHGRAFNLSYLVEQVLAELVVRGRTLEISWAELGRGMGMTPQGVSKLVERRQIQPASEVDALRSALMPQLKKPAEKASGDWALSALRKAVTFGTNDDVEYAADAVRKVCQSSTSSEARRALPVLHWKGREINFI